MAGNEHQNPNQRISQKSITGSLEMDDASAITAKIEALSLQVAALKSEGPHRVSSICEICTGGHDTRDCTSGSVHYMNNFQKPQYPVSNNYSPDYCNHPNFSWRDNQQASQHSSPFNQQGGNRPYFPSGSQQNQYQPRPPPHQPPGFQQYQSKTSEKSEIEELRLMWKSQAVSIKNIENQIGQLANAMLSRPQGNLPSDTEPNPRADKEHVKAIMLKSGRTVGEPVAVKEKEPEVEKEAEKEEELVEKIVKEPTKEKSAPVAVPKEIVDSTPQVYPPPPFPQRLQKQKVDSQLAKFLEIFKKLTINIPFAEALENMPSYARFMKGIISKKVKLDDWSVVALTEECSAVLLEDMSPPPDWARKLPPKLKDPGSFHIPCTIGDVIFEKCLCDLGASINLMPLSVCEKMGLEPTPSNMTLQLADGQITYPWGIVENVLVKVGKFILPADFVILDCPEDSQLSLILGRPFLATGKTTIDVPKGELTMKVQDEEVVFKMFKESPVPVKKEEECFTVELPEMGAKNRFDKLVKAEVEEGMTVKEKKVKPPDDNNSRTFKRKLKKWLSLFPGKVRSKKAGPLKIKVEGPRGSVEIFDDDPEEAVQDKRMKLLFGMGNTGNQGVVTVNLDLPP